MHGRQKPQKKLKKTVLPLLSRGVRQSELSPVDRMGYKIAVRYWPSTSLLERRGTLQQRRFMCSVQCAETVGVELQINTCSVTRETAKAWVHCDDTTWRREKPKLVCGYLARNFRYGQETADQADESCKPRVRKSTRLGRFSFFYGFKFLPHHSHIPTAKGAWWCLWSGHECINKCFGGFYGFISLHPLRLSIGNTARTPWQPRTAAEVLA